MTATILRGDARRLPLPDASVDLIVTSPPYWALRSYTDGGQHYDGQIGAEPTPAAYIDNLIECTREWMRVLKPSGSMWINLGDKYARPGGGVDKAARSLAGSGKGTTGRRFTSAKGWDGPPEKSLIGLPWRYAIRCIDDLGLILRAEVIWEKPNGLPESVTDRVRRSHETWFHLVKQPRYFSAVDTIREPHEAARRDSWDRRPDRVAGGIRPTGSVDARCGNNPLGKLPSSVWTIATQPLKLPAELGVDHFACVDTDTEILTRRGWLRHDQVQVGDEVAGYDLDTGLTSWTGCHGVHRYDFDGELVTAEARGLSMRLTPNHRTLVHDHRGRHRLRGPIEVIDAAALDPQHAIPRAVEWAEDGREKSIGADLAALFGWVAAEGWYSANRRLVYLSQSQTANAAKVVQIGALLDRLGTGHARTERNREWRGRPAVDVQWRISRDLSAQIVASMPDKLLPTWMADLPLDEARALLDAFVDGDGHRRVDGRLSVFQKIRHNLNVLQAVAVRLGYNTTLRKSGGRWVLYLNPPRPARLRRADGTSLVGCERYAGEVWCVTTGTGTFVARRNGTVFVTGNSFPLALPRRIIQGWSPSGICTVCGEGRRSTTSRCLTNDRGGRQSQRLMGTPITGGEGRQTLGWERVVTITGDVCACPDTTAPTRPAVILDPFGGTGTTALVAHALGRHGISVDMSADYCRLARWRTTDPGQLAAALEVERPRLEHAGQLDLFAPDPHPDIPEDTA